MFEEFLEFHSIEQRLINSVRNPASERRRIVIFLHFPNCYRINTARESTINTTSKGSYWNAIASNCRKFARVVITLMSLCGCLYEHVDDSCEVRRRSLVAFLLVHRKRAGGTKPSLKLFELLLGLVLVHQFRPH